MSGVTQNIVASLVLVAALVFLYNPLDFWMPTEFQMVTAGLIAVIAAVFVGLVFRDEGRDEREVELRGKAARFGYIAGVLILTLSIVVELASGGHPEPWILASLGAMIVVRLIVRSRDS